VDCEYALVENILLNGIYKTVGDYFGEIKWFKSISE
jgi:hypothetical protein